MTGQDDLEQRLPGYLASRAPTPPPGVLEAILRETAEHPQRRGLAFAAVGWLGLGAAAVAVVVAAIVFGSGLVSFPVAPGAHATPSPSATPSMTTVVLPVPVRDKAIAEEAATIFEARLRALGIGNFTSSIGDDIRFSFVPPPSISAVDVDAVLHTAGHLEWLAWSEGMPVVMVGDTVPAGIPVLFDQSHITSVALTTMQYQSPPIAAVEIHLDALATQAFATYTSSHVNQPGPVALDGRVLTTPTIQAPITDGDVVITFGSGPAEPGSLSAAAMAAILQSGPVPSGWTISSSGEPVPSTAPSPPSVLPSFAISADRAVQLAQEHTTLTTLVFVKAGRFADLNTNNGTGAGYPIKPDDLVWAVRFSGDITICNPLGACYSPRPGTTTVFLDYATGDFRTSETDSPAN